MVKNPLSLIMYLPISRKHVKIILNCTRNSYSLPATATLYNRASQFKEKKSCISRCWKWNKTRFVVANKSVSTQCPVPSARCPLTYLGTQSGWLILLKHVASLTWTCWFCLSHCWPLRRCGMGSTAGLHSDARKSDWWLAAVIISADENYTTWLI